MKKRISLILCIQFAVCCLYGQARIDRKALVDRHRVVTTQTDPQSPAQVGNGEFAFGVDITGLQTFIPFNTLSNWGWHSVPLPPGVKAEDFKQTSLDTHGRQVLHDLPNPDQPELTRWLSGNPHRFNLGRIGLQLTRADGSPASEGDLTDTRQEVDMWTGIVTSRFRLEGIPVTVKTACHPVQDAIGVTVESPLVKTGRISAYIAFPYTGPSYNAQYIGTYDKPDAHRSVIIKHTETSAFIARTMDDARYFVALQWTSPTLFSESKVDRSHRFELKASDSELLSFTCHFSPEEKSIFFDAESVFQGSSAGWNDFWQSGAAIDLSESKDPRWRELERRVVLSQYVMKVNEAGSLPPQESGLVNNSWYGRFHFEMIWWHSVHYALWNRWSLWDKSLPVYRNYLPTSVSRAEKQGYKGARWPKCTGDFDREWPDRIHATLIWQQPHPIYFAELDYRQHPTRATLDKWKDVVFATADFMADFAYYDKTKGAYVLGPPVYIVSENTDPMQTVNPAFELGYWRFGLRVANEWRERLSLPAEKKWKEVEENLSPLPVEDGVYETYEGISDMWQKYTFEHPALIGTFGMLPGDGVDRATFFRTLDKVGNAWNFNRTWGWDFPMLAMAAARSGKPDLALIYMMHHSPNFQFDAHGLATGGPFPYFPSNGAFLTAIAMMAGGWDGSSGAAPGFPDDGSWVVKAEGFAPMP